MQNNILLYTNTSQPMFTVLTAIVAINRMIRQHSRVTHQFVTISKTLMSMESHFGPIHGE